MAASKSSPPSLPPRLGGPLAASHLARAGIVDPEADEIAVWTDEAERRATELFTIVGPDGRFERGALPAFEPALAREAYRAMLRARALDEGAAALVKAGRIGSYADARGTEAAVVGAVAALAPEDFVAPGRGQTGAALFRGLPVSAVAAQLFGNANDPSRGRQLPGCATAPRALRVLPAAAGAGRQLPVAAGLAWAAKMQRQPTVALAYLDAGETDAEDFHAGLNFAGVFRVPAIFVCVGVRAAASAGLSKTVAIKALGYGIAGVRVDGHDLLAVLASVRDAAERARRGEGATLIETVPGADDPIARTGSFLAAGKILAASELAELAAEVQGEVRAALETEQAVGLPGARAIIEDVWARMPRALEDQLDELDRVRDKTVRP